MTHTVTHWSLIKMRTTGFFTPSLNGLLLKDVGDFQNTQQWKNPVFKYFFDHYRIDSDIDKVNYLNLFWEKAFAIFLILLFSPILIVVAMAIKISSRGDILFKQVRIGKDGKEFKILKFRTMVMDAEVNTGHVLSWSGDPRITKLGAFLRKSHLDELPQLLNVLRGDMAFIGPRPERPEFTNVYDKEITNYSDRHFVKPGITGLAQIALVYDATAEQKLKYDLMYIGFKESYLLNGLIALYTAKKMVFLKDKANLV